eukprot:CAMPEP_0197882492 /NCGR_PEP_ID=MMETSP1439-20131203/9610_1 /TAXON_ID=66791 /ORGANISM="Gonyaulax spinifera, Strain CCMP409" /LENGTH=411 /DNA_ID=CAMNT_0043502151 /DNA_START=181 /DNA_END=1416 /DNA_ORIENTATION=+
MRCRRGVYGFGQLYLGVNIFFADALALSHSSAEGVLYDHFRQMLGAKIEPLHQLAQESSNSDLRRQLGPIKDSDKLKRSQLQMTAVAEPIFKKEMKQFMADNKHSLNLASDKAHIALVQESQTQHHSLESWVQRVRSKVMDDTLWGKVKGLLHGLASNEQWGVDNLPGVLDWWLGVGFDYILSSDNGLHVHIGLQLRLHPTTVSFKNDNAVRMIQYFDLGFKRDTWSASFGFQAYENTGPPLGNITARALRPVIMASFPGDFWNMSKAAQEGVKMEAGFKTLKLRLHMTSEGPASLYPYMVHFNKQIEVAPAFRSMWSWTTEIKQVDRTWKYEWGCPFWVNLEKHDEQHQTLLPFSTDYDCGSWCKPSTILTCDGFGILWRWDNQWTNEYVPKDELEGAKSEVEHVSIATR